MLLRIKYIFLELNCSVAVYFMSSCVRGITLYPIYFLVTNVEYRTQRKPLESMTV